MLSTLLLLVSLMAHPFAWADRQSEKATQDAKMTDLIQRIERGDDPNALLEAGRTGNLAFVPHLREKLHHDAYKHESLKWQAQMALAKLNQPDQLQAIYCQVATGNDFEAFETMDALIYVHGWFAIRILNDVVSGKIASKPKLAQIAPDIQYPTPPKYAAVPALAAMFPDQGNGLPSEKTFSFWPNYIGIHNKELKKLQPTGEGVTFSPSACKGGKPRKKLT